MPKRSNKFQTLIFQIQEHFKVDPEVTVTESKLLTHVVTGERREVDIVVESLVNGIPITIGFECISHKRKMGCEWVERMLKKHQHLPTNQLILVSESGFYRPALKLVESETTTSAVTFEEAEDVNWPAFLTSLENLTFSMMNLEWVKSTAHYHKNTNSHLEIAMDGTTRIRLLNTDQEMDVKQFSTAVLNTRDVARLVFEKWAEVPKPKKSASLNFTVNWKPATGTAVIKDAENAYPLQTVDIAAKGKIKDSTINLSVQSFMGTAVVHGVIDDPMPTMDASLGDQAVVAITKGLNSGLKGSISFPNATDQMRKTFPATFPEGREYD
jgi:hypothetical protein